MPESSIFVMFVPRTMTFHVNLNLIVCAIVELLFLGSIYLEILLYKYYSIFLVGILFDLIPITYY
jgi:hypothetical protein